MTSANRPARLRKMIRRVRLDELCRTKNCQARRPRLGPALTGTPASAVSASNLPSTSWVVLSSTVGPARFPSRHDSLAPVNLPVRSPDGSCRRPSDLLEAIADAVQCLDHVEIVIDLFEFLAQALDVAVDRAIVHIDLIVVGGVHQGVAALHHTGAGRKRLQDQEFRDG